MPHQRQVGYYWDNTPLALYPSAAGRLLVVHSEVCFSWFGLIKMDALKQT
jgi:hypothetical protein